mmetsp:Transcript_1960/g.5762  ORF Transcript_1960/g.5762 Transcript_1960/m.5762 type:complete len:261 (+) Transcript_1960:1210-1992(+)
MRSSCWSAPSASASDTWMPSLRRTKPVVASSSCASYFFLRAFSFSESLCSLAVWEISAFRRWILSDHAFSLWRPAISSASLRGSWVAIKVMPVLEITPEMTGPPEAVTPFTLSSLDHLARSSSNRSLSLIRLVRLASRASLSVATSPCTRPKPVFSLVGSAPRRSRPCWGVRWRNIMMRSRLLSLSKAQNCSWDSKSASRLTVRSSWRSSSRTSRCACGSSYGSSVMVALVAGCPCTLHHEGSALHGGRVAEARTMVKGE